MLDDPNRKYVPLEIIVRAQSLLLCALIAKLDKTSHTGFLSELEYIFKQPSKEDDEDTTMINEWALRIIRSTMNG